ncbi:HAD family hydrolase [Candidatus Dependentiae bacterium]|nr:HAD family hydrolase [Candidatus Dependentiae bacterium]
MIFIIGVNVINSIKIFLFDIDGTLVRLDGAGLRALDKAFFDIFKIKDISYKVDFYGKTDPAIYECILEIAGIPTDYAQKYYNQIAEKYLDYLKLEIDLIEKNPVIEGVIDFLELIKDNKKIYTGLLTGNIEQGGYIKIGKWGLTKYFGFGAFGSDSKIRSDLVSIALNRAKKKYGLKNIGLKNIFVIGDTPLDIKCAQDNGVVSVAVATGKYTAEYLKSFNPDYCLKNLNEFNFE